MGLDLGFSSNKQKNSNQQSGSSNEVMNSLSNANTTASNTGGFNNSATGSQTANFSPEGQSLLSALTARLAQPQTAGRDALTSLATGGGINPYVESSISRSNEEAQRQMQQAQAGMRAGNRGIGQNANLFGQADAASLFLSRLAGENANTRVGAFENAQNRQLSAAGSAAGLEQGDSGIAANLIGLTRGTDSTQQQAGTTFEDMISQIIQNQNATSNKKFDTKGTSTGKSSGFSAGIS